MPTNTKNLLLIGIAVISLLGIVWLGSMMVMHVMMMGRDRMTALMAFFLLVLMLVGVSVLFSWRRGVRNKDKK